MQAALSEPRPSEYRQAALHQSALMVQNVGSRKSTSCNAAAATGSFRDVQHENIRTTEGRQTDCKYSWGWASFSMKGGSLGPVCQALALTCLAPQRELVLLLLARWLRPFMPMSNGFQ